MTETQRAVLGIWSFQGLGPQALARLEARIPRGDWLRVPWRELISRFEGLKAPVIEGLLQCRSLEERIAEVEQRLAADGERVCFPGDPQYPTRLSGIGNAPPLLFYRGPGAVAQSRGRVAIVGTRHTTKEWLSWTARFARGCAQQSLVVASGAAEGVDTAAHTGALWARGITWAFVASGIDQIDPTPKRIVDRLLAAGGSVFSEYPPGTRANEGLFVRRNRLISGSSDVVVIVRGGEKSGARHTAAFANEQQRPLLAVAGGPEEKGGELCRDVLRAGGRPCFDETDVLRQLSLTAMPAAAPMPAVRGEVSAEAGAVFSSLPQGLFDLEQALTAVPEVSSGSLSAALMELEIAGWLASRSGRRYEKRE
ncbi:MAG: DNA-protecting protein DprA [Myxococcaceae bacterium]|nr:DNA-protecting protein DprA [Myxococcaceae bacterium]